MTLRREVTHYYYIRQFHYKREVIDLIFFVFLAGPDLPEWRARAFVAYFKGKLYYLGGYDPKSNKDTNRVDVK